MALVSVIIPVYKSEKVLENAVKSVLNQAFDDFEIVLIDDGSPDQSLALCSRLAEADAHIKVYHKENGGICSARNYGMEKASGKYIAFLDHDDTYMPGYLQDHVLLLEREGADCVKFENRRTVLHADGTREIIHGDRIKDLPEIAEGVAVYDQERIRKYYPQIRDAVKSMYIWDGIYKRSFLERFHIRFDESFKFGHEDIMFNLRVYAHASKAVFHAGEYYDHNYDKITNTSSIFHPNRVKDAVKTVSYEAQMLRKWHYPSSEILSSYMNEFYRVLGIISLAGRSIPQKKRNQLMRLFRERTVMTLDEPEKAVRALRKKRWMHAFLADRLLHERYMTCTVLYELYNRIVLRRPRTNKRNGAADAV